MKVSVEAQALHKPVVITDYPTAKSQLKDGYDGVIVPLDNEKCAEAINKVLRNAELINTIQKNTLTTDYSHYCSVDYLVQLIND